MIQELLLGAAEYWTAATITAWTVGLAAIISALVGAHKGWVSYIEGRDKAKLDIAKSQLEYIIKPQIEYIVNPLYRRIEDLEKERRDEKRERAEERKERAEERILFEEHKTIINIFADHFTIVYRWIDENIVDRKTPMPELPPKLEKYREGEKQ